MFGAIIGDIVGSRWEFDPTNNYDFQIFSAENGFTDDTICTIGVADALLHGSDDYGKFIHKWCRKYPHPMGGYGWRFSEWVASDDPKPYNSFGNGSAMRVSPVAMWFADTDEAKEEAQKTAACSHNHPEGMKGASAVAEAINMAIHACLGKSDAERTQLAKEICKTVSSNNGYNFNIDLQSVTNKFDETCQGTVPVAFRIIADSQSFEDAIRKAVALGADADTLGAIVGSIAEHIWGIPDWIKGKALSYLPEEMRNIIKSFYEKVNLSTK